MKKTIFLSFIMTLLVCPIAKAQQTPITKANYELAARYSFERINRMVYSQTVSPKWFENSDKFWYSWKDSNGWNYFIVDPVAKTKKPIFDLDKLAMELTTIIHDPYDAQHLPIRNLKLVDDKAFEFDIQSTRDEKVEDKKAEKDGEKAKKSTRTRKKVFYFSYDLKSEVLTDVTEAKKKEREEKEEQREAEKKNAYPRWANIAPDSSYVVYGKGLDLYYTDMENLHKIMKDEKDASFEEHRLTTDGTKILPYSGRSYGKNEIVDTVKRHGVYLIWSPDAKYFVLERTDYSNSKSLWVINSLASPRPKLETYSYHMPGEPRAKTYTSLFNMSDKSHKLIDSKIVAYKEQNTSIIRRRSKPEDKDKKYVASVWHGDNTTFYFSRMSRDLHRRDYCTYNVEKDEVKSLIEERTTKYIDVTYMRILEKDDRMLLMSERNGWSHLYLHDKDGKLINPVTTGAFHVSKVSSIDEKEGVIYFVATGYDKNENPYYNHLFRVNMDGSGLKMINPGNYDTRTYLSTNKKFVVSNYSRVDTAPASVVYTNNGVKVMDLETADLSQLLQSGYKFPEVIKVKAADGITDLWGVMYKPYDFDSTKLYPIIEYVYPGPQVESTVYFWSKGMHRTDRLAQLGFIVVTIGQRGGHPDRSKWYHTFGYGNMRDYPLADHKAAIQQLAAQHKYIDINKVGIHGHSGGGFMSTAAILTYPDFYKVAVSCAGNHDNRIYNSWWSETHHGIKEVVSDKGDTTFKYSIHYNQELVKNLKGRLLLVHGDMDNNVHPANSIRVANALIRANKRFDMLILPGQRHGFGDMTEYFFWKMADYFSRYLIGDYENSVDIIQMNNDK